MVGLLGVDRHAGHEAEGLGKIGEPEAAQDCAAIFAQRPAGQGFQHGGNFGIGKTGNRHGLGPLLTGLARERQALRVSLAPAILSPIAAPMQPCRLAAANLACRRGDRVLFRGLALDLNAGQACQVAGANGIGKSSLIRLLAGLAEPFAGTVERLGEVGLVDERPALDPHLPLGRALAFWERFDGRSATAVGRLGLAELADVPVRFLSTGQRKRAALARLIAQQAAIWLLDEPLNGLDVDAVREVETIVAEHCAAGGLAVIASHQPIALPGGQRLELRDYAA